MNKELKEHTYRIMYRNYFKIWIFIILIGSCLEARSQISENLKVALAYKIANCIIWHADTSTVFTIGVLSNNRELSGKFSELSQIAKINKKSIRIIVFTGTSALRPVQMLYVGYDYNSSLTTIIQKINQWNTLLVTEECDKPGEIMVNLKMESKQGILSFEYNRANILYAGLELTEQIVLLKGSEIEIRELYLRAKRLWDQQKRKADSLEVQTEIQEKNLKIRKDSIAFVRRRMEENASTIQKQNQIIASKDSESNQKNIEIQVQKAEISHNRSELEQFNKDRDTYIDQIYVYQTEVNKRKILSDSLSIDIKLKKEELAERKKALGEKETIINKQSNWLLLLGIIIAIICVLVFIIFKAYLTNKRAKLKIAEQKEELETILEKLQNTQEQLIQSEKMASLGVLVAGIAHEINNPVNFINSGIAGIEKVVNKILIFLQELSRLQGVITEAEIRQLTEIKDKLNIKMSIEKIPEIIENIKLGISRTISIIDGLRLYTRVDKEEKSITDINKIIETSLLLLRPQIRDHVEIITNYGKIPQVYVFPAKLSQVFVNLLSNAIDASVEVENMPEKPVIEIHTKTRDHKIIIEISDMGKGIPDEILKNIFDPFFTTKSVGKGTGLGLSISYGIITEHNGHIFAGNNQKKGATFTVELPVNI